MTKKKLQNRKGFTLIELLVAIAIIGILSVMGFASFTQAQKKARNSRRKADLRAMQNAQEQYMSEHGSYQTLGGTCNTAITGMLDVMPEDPKPGVTGYACTDCAATDAYCITVALEDDTSGNCSGCTAGCAFATANTNSFCVKNLQ